MRIFTAHFQTHECDTTTQTYFSGRGVGMDRSPKRAVAKAKAAANRDIDAKREFPGTPTLDVLSVNGVEIYAN